MPASLSPEGSPSATPDPATAIPSPQDDFGAKVDLHPDFSGPGNVVIMCKDDDDEKDGSDVGFLVMGHILRVVSPTFNDFLALTASRVIEVDDTPDDMHAFLRILNVRPDNPTAFAASAEHFLATRSLMDKYCCGPHIVGVLYRAAEMRAAQIIARVDGDDGGGCDRVGPGDPPDDDSDGGPVHAASMSGAGEPAGVGPNQDVQAQGVSVPMATEIDTATTATATKPPTTDSEATTSSTAKKSSGNGSHSPPRAPSQYRTKSQALHCLTLAHSLRSHTLWREICTALHTRTWWRETLNPVTLTEDDIDTVGADVFRVLVLLAMMGSVDGLFDRVEQLAVGYNKSKGELFMRRRDINV